MSAKESAPSLLANLYSAEPTENFLSDEVALPEYPELSTEHSDALRRIIENRKSFILGPVHSGKTFLLSIFALILAKAGKKTLIVASNKAEPTQFYQEFLRCNK